MASLATRSASQALRAASRRAPRAAAAKNVLKSTQTASYSLLAKAATKPVQKANVQVFRLRFQALSHAKYLISQGVRGIKTLDFAGTKEVVYERSDWPLAKLQDYFKNDTLALIGYGSQGHGQGLNARDNGLNVIVGVRKDGESWKQAMADGWVHGFSISALRTFLTLSSRSQARPCSLSRKPLTRVPSS